MKILFHSIYYPPEVGGLESHIAELARGLVEAGHEVRVITSRSQEGLPREEVLDGVRVHRSWLPSRSPAGWIAYALRSGPLTREWAQWADVVHAQAFASVYPCHKAVRRTGRPLVATLHTSHFLIRARTRRWTPVLARLVRWPDYCLAASREIAGVAESLAPGVQVEALTNGVDTERFRPVPPAFPRSLDQRRLVVPRRLFEKNGVEYFIRALPLIRRQVPEVEALVVGDGPERKTLEALAGELGVGDVARFLGARPHDEMPGILSSGDVAVFPSLMEATSVAALECMACGLPVVATRVGGLPEIVDDSVGRLVPPAHAEGLAQAAVELLERTDLAAMGAAGSATRGQHWSNARLVARHVEIYRGLVAPDDLRTGESPGQGAGGHVQTK